MTKDNSSINYAGFWVRIGSISIDNILLLSIFIIFEALLIILHPYLGLYLFLKAYVLTLLFFIIGGIFYFVWLNAKGRQTLGKQFFGIQVTNTKHQPISLTKSIFRSILSIFTNFFWSVGNLFIVTNSKKKALHDMLLGTYVIRTKSKRSKETLLIILILTLNIAYSGIVFITLQDFIATTAKVPTAAMQPTILAGDRVVIDRYEIYSNSPQRGDIVVFDYPLDPNLMYAKRCIGLPGDTIAIINDTLWVNNEECVLQAISARTYDPNTGQFTIKLLEKLPKGCSYTIEKFDFPERIKENFGPITIPVGHYFVLGDSRDNSADSRMWGFLPKEYITGKVGIICWSWDKYLPLSNLSQKIRWNRIWTELK